MKNLIKDYQILLGSLLLIMIVGLSHLAIMEEIQSRDTKESKIIEEFTAKLSSDLDLLKIKRDIDLIIKNQNAITDNQGLLNSKLEYIRDRQELMEKHPHWVSHLYD